MLFSRLSRFVSHSAGRWWVKGITYLLRVAVGGTFLVSGFAKGVDPWGSVYKIQEYLHAMGMAELTGIAVPASFLLSGAEFLIGAMLLLGCFRRGAAVMAFATMCFMLPFSAWVALRNPVSDCGCFGDAFVISNAATFWKNVALTLAAMWLVPFNRKIHWGVTPALQWFAALAFSLFIVFVEYTGYVAQPIIDFRPYKIGSKLLAAQGAESDPEYEFIYKRGEETRSFSIDSLPDEAEGWEYVDRRALTQPVVNSGAGVGNLHLWEGDSDVTGDVLPSEGKVVILTIPDVAHATPASAWKINALADRAQRRGETFLAAVAGGEVATTDWAEATSGAFGIYTADDTVLKEMVRGEPGVVELTDGTITWKSALKNIDGDEVMLESNDVRPLEALTMLPARLRRLTPAVAILSIVLATLMLLSFSTKLPFAQRIKRREERMLQIQRERKMLRKLRKESLRHKGVQKIHSISKTSKTSRTSRTSKTTDPKNP